jgi:hypothetical protein
LLLNKEQTESILVLELNFSMARDLKYGDDAGTANATGSYLVKYLVVLLLSSRRCQKTVLNG